jgi:HJR/Mrr/RecB family endonuclease
MIYLESIMHQITPQIMGADKSIDIAIDNGSYLKESNIEDLLMLSDQRIEKRVILSGFSKRTLETYLKKFYDLNLRSRAAETDIDLIIIDKTQLYCINKSINELKSYPVPIYYTNNHFLVKEQMEFFDYLWSQDSETILYNELEKIHKPNFAESIFYGSNSLKEGIFTELKKDPKLLYKIDPREFEELIALILNKLGYRTFPTQRTRDGGKDILAKFNTPDGHEGLCLIECKRYSPERKVGVETVRSLFGVVKDEKATLGMIVTTSSYSKPAQEFYQRHKHTISLKDFEDLNLWINNNST